MTGNAPAASIDQLWREALSAVHHAAGCSCCGGPAVRMDAATLEQDVLYYLHRRYMSANPGLAEAVERRREAPQGSFPAWLDDLAAGMPTESAEIITADLCRLLRSIVTAR
jgi:hypothetical protein